MLRPAVNEILKNGQSYYSLVIAVAYCFSGYSGLYSSQRIMYSKTRAEFINTTTH